jgi:hypothetical protein
LSVAVVVLEGSTMVVVLNALRLLAWRERANDLSATACNPRLPNLVSS